MISHDDDKRHVSAPPTSEEHPLPVAAEEEPESLHPSVGESWAPKSRDDHMNGLRNSEPELRPATKVAQAEAEKEHDGGFFGAISDAFDLSHAHASEPGSLPRPPRVPSIGTRGGR